jgi:hypothetical protein
MHITEQGSGQVVQSGNDYRLSLPAVGADAYHNAQISTYTDRRTFEQRAPLRLQLRAYAEGELQGTAGFGLWNHPYDPTMRGLPSLPRAVWFFHATPPNKMALALDVPGNGWKCATFDAGNWRFLALLPVAPLGFLLMRIPALYRRLWPVGQRALNVSEHALPADLLHEPHDYTLDWQADSVTFAVDGVSVYHTDRTPRGPLGFVAWVDNQYAVVTPQGRFGFGLVAGDSPQALVIEDLRLETGAR